MAPRLTAFRQENLTDNSDLIASRYNFPPPDDNRSIQGSTELAEAISKLTRAATLPSEEKLKIATEWAAEPEPAPFKEPEKPAGDTAFTYAAHLAARLRAGVGRVKDFIGGTSFDDIAVELDEIELEEEGAEAAEEEAEEDEDEEDAEEIFGVKVSTINEVSRRHRRLIRRV